MTFAIRDPRILVIAEALAHAAHEADQEDLDLGLHAYAEVAVRALDEWLLGMAKEAKRKNAPPPRIYGFKWCDCTEFIHATLGEPPPPERPARDN